MMSTSTTGGQSTGARQSSLRSRPTTTASGTALRASKAIGGCPCSAPERVAGSFFLGDETLPCAIRSAIRDAGSDSTVDVVGLGGLHRCCSPACRRHSSDAKSADLWNILDPGPSAASRLLRPPLLSRL